MLLTVAEARQASVSETTLNLYIKTLAEWPIDFIQHVCTQMAMVPRREGETAFPTLGDFMEALKMHRARKAQEKANRRESEYREKNFWSHIDDLKETSGMSEQEVLDSIRVPGFTGRKARSLGN